MIDISVCTVVGKRSFSNKDKTKNYYMVFCVADFEKDVGEGQDCFSCFVDKKTYDRISIGDRENYANGRTKEIVNF